MLSSQWKKWWCKQKKKVEVNYAVMKECAGGFIAGLRDQCGMAERVRNSKRMCADVLITSRARCCLFVPCILLLNQCFKHSYVSTCEAMHVLLGSKLQAPLVQLRIHVFFYW
jgi:hypothetical protein